MSLRNNKEKVHFLSFYTEGHGKDLGLNLVEEAEILTGYVNEFFSTVTIESPKSLINRDPRWIEIFKDRRSWVKERYEESVSGFRWNENWAALNFLAWKPYLIKSELVATNKIDFGEILFYHDVNVTKYPDYLLGLKDLVGYLRSMMDGRSVLLFNDDNLPFGVDCKKELIDKYQCQEFESEGHTWAGAIAIRKDKQGIKFISDWVEMVSDIDNVSPVTNSRDQIGYFWHSPEQACLSILYFRNLHNPLIKRMFLYDRRRIPPVKTDKLFYFLRRFHRIVKKIHSKIWS